MAKKITSGRIGGRTTSGKTPITGSALVPVEEHVRALAEIPAEEVKAVVQREQGTTLVIGRPYVAGDITIEADEVYYVDDLRRAQPEGPWLGEADKVAWRDPDTGFECIMMRDTHRGYLSGYVGVPVSHPLHGFEHQAVPADLGIEVHGGLTYSRICEEGPTPERRIVSDARRICHVPNRPARYVPTANATDYRVEDAHAWWLGFDCNHAYDVVPDDLRRRPDFLVAEIGAEYRDDAYVCREVLALAAQLRAIADGVPVPPREGRVPPPAGLDPREGA